MAKTEIVETKDQLPATLLSDFAVMQMEDPNEAKAIIQEAFEGGIKSHLDLSVLTVPSGKSAGAWQIPSIDGEPDIRTVLEGVILRVQPARVYYGEPYEKTGGGKPPACASRDAVVGVGEPGGECSKCSLAQFGTLERNDGTMGAGQACAERRLIWMLVPDLALPVVVNAPPTSLKSIKEFVRAVASQMIRPFQIRVGLTLEKDKSSDGHDFWKIVPKRIGGKDAKITGPELEMIKGYAEVIAPIIESVDMSQVAPQEEVPYNG